MRIVELFARTEDLDARVPTLLIFGRAADAGPIIIAYADEVTMETDVNLAEALIDQ